MVSIEAGEKAKLTSAGGAESARAAIGKAATRPAHSRVLAAALDRQRQARLGACSSIRPGRLLDSRVGTLSANLIPDTVSGDHEEDTPAPNP